MLERFNCFIREVGSYWCLLKTNQSGASSCCFHLLWGWINTIFVRRGAASSLKVFLTSFCGCKLWQINVFPKHSVDNVQAGRAFQFL